MGKINEERRNIAMKRLVETITKSSKIISDLDYETMPLIYYLPKIANEKEIINLGIEINRNIENIYKAINELREIFVNEQM